MAQRPGSVGIYTCDGVSTEIAESKCAHCERFSQVPSLRKLTDYVDICRQCNALICLGCAGKPCTPFMRKIDAIESEFYRREQFRKSLGV